MSATPSGNLTKIACIDRMKLPHRPAPETKAPLRVRESSVDVRGRSCHPPA